MSELNRLLGAIEELLEAETLALRGGDVKAAAAVQQRVAPVIKRLVEVIASQGAGTTATAALAERVHQVREHRRTNMDLLAALRAERGQLRERLTLAGERLRRLKPAYGLPRHVSFSAAG